MFQNKKTGTFLVAQWLRLRTPNSGGLGLIPRQGTRSHMHATTKGSHATTKDPPHHRNEGASKPQLRIPPATTKTRCNEINNFFFKRENQNLKRCGEHKKNFKYLIKKNKKTTLRTNKSSSLAVKSVSNMDNRKKC